MRKGFTLPEGIIALAIISLSVVVLSTLAINYLSILTSVRQRFLALNFVQEGLQLALALRNKQIESGSSPWLGVTSAGTYCLSFNTSSLTIVFQPSPSPCLVSQNYSRLITYQDFQNPNKSDLTDSNAVRVTSQVFFGRDEVKLDTVITRWHPMQ